MNTSITDKLPVDSLSDTVAESLGRVGEFVPDHVPGSVTDVVAGGVSQGRRFGRNVAGRLPGRRGTSNSTRWAAVLTALGLFGVALVIWRVRSSRRDDAVGREAWTTSGSVPGASDRDVA